MKNVLNSKSLLAMTLISGLSGLATTAHADLAALKSMRTNDFLLGTAPTGCQPKGLRSDAEGKFAYVAEMCGKKINGVRVATVSVYNLKTLSLETTIVTPSGSKQGIIGNTEVNFTLDQNYVLAARAEGDSESSVYPNKGMVTAIDTRTQEIKEFIPVNATGSKIVEPRPMVEGDDRQIVYIANYFSDDISVLDVTGMDQDTTKDGSRRLIGKIHFTSAFTKPGAHGISLIAPRGISFTKDGRYGIVDASTTGSIFIVDAVKNKQIAELAPIPEDLGSVPLRQQGLGKTMNVRHVVMTNDGKMVYLSHMRGDAVSRISVDKLISKAIETHEAGESVIPAEFWHELIVPFANGKSVLQLKHYPADHPNFPNQDWDLVRPNTIVLDPVDNRYLYVSCRTDTDPDYTKYKDTTKGKVDVIDTTTGEEIFTFVGGTQPTALEVTPDNSLLISGGFKDSKLYFFDIRKLLDIYEREGRSGSRLSSADRQ